MPARIEDVAQRCGLSVATVSRVMNNGKNVSASARERVMRAIDELNYSPNALARSLIRRRTYQLGVVVPDISTSFASTILGSIERSAAQRGYNILLCNIMGDLEKECQYLEAFRQMRVDGLIILHEKTDGRVGELLSALDVPVVACTVRLTREAVKNCSVVVIDDYAAARLAVQRLLEDGHRKIAVFCDVLDEYSSGELRSRGAEDALRAYGYEPGEMFFRYGRLSYDDGYRHMSELLRAGERPTAVFAASDDCAVGAMTAALDAGLRVPEELSVVGFDDAAVAARVRPRLSTIRQPLDEMGRIAAAELIRHIEEPETKPATITVKHEFIQRESSAPVRSAQNSFCTAPGEQSAPRGEI